MGAVPRAMRHGSTRSRTLVLGTTLCMTGAVLGTRNGLVTDPGFYPGSPVRSPPCLSPPE